MVTAIISTLTGIAGAPRRRHDRRGHAARPRPADRRPQGKAARGAARRHHQGADPGREREGSRRDPGQHQRRAWRSSPVTHVDEVLALALATPVVPIEWTEADELAATAARRRSLRPPTTTPARRSGTDASSQAASPSWGRWLLALSAVDGDYVFPFDLRLPLSFTCSTAAATSHWSQGFERNEQAGAYRTRRRGDAVSDGGCFAGGRSRSSTRSPAR